MFLLPVSQGICNFKDSFLFLMMYMVMFLEGPVCGGEPRSVGSPKTGVRGGCEVSNVDLGPESGSSAGGENVINC